MRDFVMLITLSRKLANMVKTLDRKIVGTRTLAELTLAWSFGIEPMVRDLTELAKLYNSVDKRVNKFINDGKKVQSYHYMKELDNVGRTDISDAACNYHYRYSESKSIYYATLKCSYDYKKPPHWESFRRVMGLNITPEVIWNAIPFSFLIDWVVKINDFLHQFDEDPNLVVHVKDYCDTVKNTKSEFTIPRNTHQEGFANGNQLMDASEYGRVRSEYGYLLKSTIYQRIPGIPDTGYAFPVLDKLSNRELVLGGALLRTFIRA